MREAEEERARREANLSAQRAAQAIKAERDRQKQAEFEKQTAKRLQDEKIWRDSICLPEFEKPQPL